jgi:hypothetical protein
MLNRSKIVIDVDSFIRAWTFGVKAAQQSRKPYRLAFYVRVNCDQQWRTRTAPHRIVSKR